MGVLTVYCDCCGTDGSNGHFVTLDLGKDGPARMTCEFCQGLLSAGLIREEWVDGVRRFRQWLFEWTPGALLPLPEGDRV